MQNRGGCVVDDDCAGDRICGTNNCQSQFNWQNGDGQLDCCDGFFNFPQTPGECSDDNCECSKEEVAAYIFFNKKLCESITDVDCWFVPGTVILNIPTNPCVNETDEVEFEGIWADALQAVTIDSTDLAVVKENTKFNVNETLKVSGFGKTTAPFSKFLLFLRTIH